VQHLSIVCPFAKIIWTIVHMAFNITLPTSIDHLFGTWLNGIIKSEKANIRVRVCALIWIIWHVQNEFIFNKSNFPSFFAGYPFGYPQDPYVVFSPAGGAAPGHRYWCNRLVTVGQDIYSRFGWRCDKRLTC
jgi:hypothetical protein